MPEQGARIPEGRCRPLRIVGGTPGDGFLGGLPPEGVVPAKATANTRFFTSLPFTEDVDACVFLHFSFDEMWDARGVVQPEPRLAEVVLANRTRVRSEAGQESELPSLSWQVMPLAVDEQHDEETGTVPTSGHKLGGRPFLMHRRVETMAEIDALVSAGGRLFAQIEFPSASDAVVDGDWPFGDGVFHLFVAESGRRWWFLWDS